jgi:uncharacterized protein (DUF1697 family)
MAPTTLVMLLRAVNIEATGRLEMAKLREVADGIGLSNPVTYHASGNLICETGLEPGEAAKRLRKALKRETGLRTRCLVRSAEELRAVVEAAPFGDAMPRRCHIVFHKTTAAADAVAAALQDRDFSPESWTAGVRETYLYLPFGEAGSPLADTARAVETHPATSRSWRTATALADLAASR